MYKYRYKTPESFSNMIMNSDGENLTGLWFQDPRDSFKHIIDCEEKKLEIFKETSKWLDIYFRGEEPDFTPKYKINNLVALLTLEKNDMSKFFVPKRGTAL